MELLFFMLDLNGIERKIIKGEEIIGFTFNQLIPRERNEDGTYNCDCKCSGTRDNVKRNDLIKDRVKSCKQCKFAQTGPKTDSVGKVCGSLEVIQELPSELRSDGKRYRRYVLAECKISLGGCGSVKKYQLDNLRPHNTVSCGECGIMQKRVASINYTHGLSNHPLHGRYHHMVDRMTKEDCKGFHRYGARLDIDPRYLGETGFVNYLSDIVDKFSDWEDYVAQGCHIDREDNDKGYWIDNMRFVSPKVNANNKNSDYHVLVSYHGQIITLSNACELAGAAYSTVSNRLADGWNIERALFSPSRRGFKRPDNYDKPATGQIFITNR